MTAIVKFKPTRIIRLGIIALAVSALLAACKGVFIAIQLNSTQLDSVNNS